MTFSQSVRKIQSIHPRAQKRSRATGIQVLLVLACLPFGGNLSAQAAVDIESATAPLEQKVIDWRRQIHQNPELSNREVETAKLVADHLTSLGMEVKTGVGVHGVIAVLKGGKPGDRVVGFAFHVDLRFGTR